MSGGLVAQEAAPPIEAPLTLAAAPLAPETAAQRIWRWQAAESAMATGMPAVAADLFDSLSAPPPGLDEGDWRLQSATAHLLAGQFGQAAVALSRHPRPESPSVLLRRALVALQLGQEAEAVALAAGVNPAQLSPADGLWFAVLDGLLAEVVGDGSRAAAALARARALSTTPAQQALVEGLVWRQQILGAGLAEGELANLRNRVENDRGRRPGFQAARLLALALHQIGRTNEAVSTLQEQLRLPGVVEDGFADQFRLLIGLMAGADAPNGREALAALLRDARAGAELQRLALQLLTAAATPGTPARAELLNLLTEQIDGPIVSPLLPELLLTRARLRAGEDTGAAALADLTVLVNRFPASALVEAALELQATLAWSASPPRYREASELLGQLRSRLPTSPGRARWALLQADCFFLNGDWALAAASYAAALVESVLPTAEVGRALLQGVSSWLRAGDLDAATALLDAQGGRSGLAQEDRWRAEWNLLTALRDRAPDDPARPLRRLERLLEGVGARLPPALEMRLRWLRARLAVDAGQPEAAAAFAGELLARFAAGDEGPLPESLATPLVSQTLLLRGEALLAADREADALAAFAELRQRFPQSAPAVLSLLLEARQYAAQNRLVEAQQRFVEVADRFAESLYAPTALFEAALMAELRGLNATLQEALALLERLVRQYPTSDLVFHARLRQGDLSRKLNDFAAAVLIYDELLRTLPNHPEVFRAELARADALVGLGAQNPARLAEAAATYERLADLPGLPAEALLEAGCKWGLAVARTEGAARGATVLWLVAQRGLGAAQSGDDSALLAPTLPRARYWLARTLLELATLREQLQRPSEARAALQVVLDADLPGRHLAEARLARLLAPAAPLAP